MKYPKKPTLNGLRGCTTISPTLRNALFITEGVLIGEVKNWTDIKRLISDYFDNNEEYNLKGDQLLNNIYGSLEDIHQLNLIEDLKKQNKDCSDRLVLLNGEVTNIPQAKLFQNYCKSIKVYLSSPPVKATFLFQYAKASEAKKKKEEINRRREEEEEQEAEMLHNGRMTAYLAIETGSLEISNNLRKKRDKGKEREIIVVEEERRTKPRISSPVSSPVISQVSSPVPVPVLEKNANDISFISTSSGGTFVCENKSESASPTIAYITSFDEITPISQEELFALSFISINLLMEERLNISGIKFINKIDDGSFSPKALDDDILSMVFKFMRALEYNTDDMLLSPKKIEHINLVTLLNTCFFNGRKEKDAHIYNYQHHEHPEEMKNMENDFKIKYVVPFLNSAFHIKDDLVIYWDVPLDIYSKSDMRLQKRQTTDAKFMTVDGKEIGVAETKPFNTPFEKVEEDRIRLAEITKKMLHRRILTAKSKKELFTFAIMISGTDVEYFVHEYKPESTNDKYSYQLLKKSSLPTFINTFSLMSLSLECLFHFKNMMMKSMASSLDIEKKYLYRDSVQEFEPTVTLLKLDD